MSYQLRGFRYSIVLAALILAVCGLGSRAVAQTVTEILPAGDVTERMAVDSTKNRIYIRHGSGNIGVYDGSSYALITSIDNPGGGISWMAVNSATNRLYIPSWYGLSVFDTAANAFHEWVEYPEGLRHYDLYEGRIGLNTNTNRVYIPVYGDAVGAGFAVYDESAGRFLTEYVGAGEGYRNLIHLPGYQLYDHIAVNHNPNVNRLYFKVSYEIDGYGTRAYEIAVVDGITHNLIATISSPFEISEYLVVNSTTNRIYTKIPDPIGGGIAVFDGNANSYMCRIAPPSNDCGATSDTYSGTWALNVNSATNRIYQVNGCYSHQGIEVYDGDTNSHLTTIELPSGVGQRSTYTTVDEATNRLFSGGPIYMGGPIVVVHLGSAVTPSGANQTVQADSTQLTFSNVTSAGITTVAPDETAAVNYSLSNNLGSYEITTSATYDTTGYYAPGTTTVADPTKGIKVVFNVPSINNEATFNNLVITHGETINGTFQMAPYNGTADPLKITYHDFASRNVWIYVPQLSPFIIVKGEVEQLQDLIAVVRTFNLRQGIYNSFDVKLQKAQDALTAARAGSRVSACGSISSFMNEVQAQTGMALTADQAQRLTISARQIRMVLGCR